jgi:hypothetical protein
VADEQGTKNRLNSGIDEASRSDDPKGIQLDRDLYCSIALKAASDLRKTLKIDEAAFRQTASSGWRDPRLPFIYRVLDEVQKAGICIQEWFEKLKDDDSTPNRADHMTRLTHQWLLDEQNFRARKLTEVLVDLVCFSATNEPEYYRDYLQLRETDAEVRWLIDLEQFFGFRRRNSEYSADWMARNIIAAEATLDVSKRWYLRNPGPFQEKWKKRGVEFSSFRQRYIRILGLALPNERAVLGQTYIHAYGSISSDVHFTPQETSWNFDPGVVNHAFNRVGLLCFAILIRCQYLLGVVPEGVNASLRKLHDENAGPAEIVGESKQEKAEVGNFVWARGHLCEVMEIMRSKFEYVSYLLRYIERSPIPEIKEDWYPGIQIHLVATKFAAEKMLRRLQTDANSDEKAKAYFLNIEGEKKNERLDKAVIILWRSVQQLKSSGARKFS